MVLYNNNSVYIESNYFLEIILLNKVSYQNQTKDILRLHCASVLYCHVVYHNINKEVLFKKKLYGANKFNYNLFLFITKNFLIFI